METRVGEKKKDNRWAPDLPSWLAALYAPVLPYLKNIKISRSGPRKHNPEDIHLPQGYTAEVVAAGFNAPVHCTFDPNGDCYVVECGHKVESRPRILKIDMLTGRQEVYFEFPPERWNQSGAVTGACWYGGHLYVMNTDTLSRILPGGILEDILVDLPGKGDHQANHPVIGPDGKIYYGQGCATNAGVVGADDYAFEWLPKFPEFCDVPAEDITLVGHNYEYPDVLGNVTHTVQSGAYVPFGTATTPGQVIPGSVRCTGAIMRCNPDGSELEVVAWGLRNPYGLAFDQNGRLFATEHGMDERGKRYILGDPDDFYEIEQERWYGWPDYASGIRLDDPAWGDGGHGREPLLQTPPGPVQPPFTTLGVHTAANGFDFCRDAAFGFEGDAFIACFGDLAPITTLAYAGKARGFKVVRVDMNSGQVVDFAVNKIEGPASKLPHSGFERPSHCQFGPDGALYVVDYGEIEIAPEKGGIRSQMGTGTLWRIRRDASQPAGRAPKPSRVIPLYWMQGVFVAAAAALAGIVLWRLFRRNKKRQS